MPNWMAELPDSVLIHYGQNHTIHMGRAVDNFGQSIGVSIKTNKAWRFVTYFPAENIIKIDGQKMLKAQLRPRF